MKNLWCTCKNASMYNWVGTSSINVCNVPLTVLTSSYVCIEYLATHLSGFSTVVVHPIPWYSTYVVCNHRYTNYVHGIGNGNSHMDIPCPVTVGSYLLTINAVWLISTLSFKFLFLRCADSLNFHLYVTTVQ